MKKYSSLEKRYAPGVIVFKVEIIGQQPFPKERVIIDNEIYEVIRIEQATNCCGGNAVLFNLVVRLRE